MLYDSNKIKENKQKFKKSLQLTLFGQISEITNSSKVETSICSSSSSINSISPNTFSSVNTLGETFVSGSERSQYSVEHQKFQSQYILGKRIQEGAQAVVYKCYKKGTNQLLAVKIMKNCEQQIIDIVSKQYSIMHTIQHQYIIQNKEIFIDYELRNIYLVMQYCPFTNLRELILNKGRFQEKQIRIILKKILKALKYLHRKGICHRDLKPDNILCSNDLKNIKIIDFEISRQKYEGQQNILMMTDTGTLNYRAPESFTGFYGKQIDVWAIGVIFFELLTGKTPFAKEYKKDTIKNIKSGQLNTNEIEISSQGINLLKRMLERDPSKRITADEAIKSEFLLSYDEFTNKDEDIVSEAETLDQHQAQYMETF